MSLLNTEETLIKSTINATMKLYHWPNSLKLLKKKSEHQIHRNNQPAATLCKFYKRSLTIPLLDQLLNDLQARFSEHSLISYHDLLPSKVVSIEKDRKNSRPVKSLSELVSPFF